MRGGTASLIDGSPMSWCAAFCQSCSCTASFSRTSTDAVLCESPITITFAGDICLRSRFLPCPMAPGIGGTSLSIRSAPSRACTTAFASAHRPTHPSHSTPASSLASDRELWGRVAGRHRCGTHRVNRKARRSGGSLASPCSPAQHTTKFSALCVPEHRQVSTRLRPCRPPKPWGVSSPDEGRRGREGAGRRQQDQEARRRGADYLHREDGALQRPEMAQTATFHSGRNPYGSSSFRGE